MKRPTYDQIFTPGAPVSRRGLLVGRDKDLRRLRRYLRRPGFHPVVIGDRGVGKTTLVKYAVGKRPIAKVNCGNLTTFENLVRATLLELGVDVWIKEKSSETKKEVEGGAKPLGVGAKVTGFQSSVEHRPAIADQIGDPSLFIRYVDKNFEHPILVYDEFDRVPRKAKEVRLALADMIKDLADNADRFSTKILVVGVARSIESLLGAHESIKRSVKQIYLGTLNESDIVDFLTKAEKATRITLSPTVKGDIASESSGFPYYAHLIGLSSVDAMKDRAPRAKIVTPQDFHQGKADAADEAFRDLLSKYQSKAYSLTRLEKAVLFVIMERPRTRRNLQEIKQSCLELFGIGEDRFQHAFKSLRAAGFLYSVGTRERVHFREPLLEPFLRIRVGKPRDPSQLSLFASTAGK